MKVSLTVLDEIHVTEPCPASWEAMIGDDRSRHCESCDKSVHHLSTMTDAEVATLVTAGEHVCVRYARHDDGRLVTLDAPLPKPPGRLRTLLVTMASWLGLSWLAGCNPVPNNIAGGIRAPSTAQHELTTGDVAPVRTSKPPRPPATTAPQAIVQGGLCPPEVQQKQP